MVSILLRINAREHSLIFGLGLHTSLCIYSKASNAESCLVNPLTLKAAWHLFRCTIQLSGGAVV